MIHRFLSLSASLACLLLSNCSRDKASAAVEPEGTQQEAEQHADDKITTPVPATHLPSPTTIKPVVVKVENTEHRAETPTSETETPVPTSSPAPAAPTHVAAALTTSQASGTAVPQPAPRVEPAIPPPPTVNPAAPSRNLESVLNDVSVKIYLARLRKAQFSIERQKQELLLAIKRRDRGEALFRRQAIEAEALEDLRREAEVASYRVREAEADAEEAQAFVDIAISRVSIGQEMPICAEIR